MTQGPEPTLAAADLLPVRYGLPPVTTTSVLTGVLLAITAACGLVFTFSPSRKQTEARSYPIGWARKPIGWARKPTQRVSQ